MKRKIITYSILLTILIVALFFRVNNAYPIVVDHTGEVHLIGIDPYFYLRHVEATFNDFPNLQKWDHGTHFPTGIVADATGLHTILMAAICKLVIWDNPSSNEIAYVLSWIPPFVSCLCYLLVFLIIKKLRGAVTGILGSALLLIYPGRFLPRGLFGFPDHHIFEVFLLLLFIYGLIQLTSHLKQKRSWPKVAILALPLISFFWVWAGSPLYLLYSILLIGSYCIFSDLNKQESNTLAVRTAIYYGFSAVLYGGSLYAYPELITVADENFHSTILYLLLLAMVIMPSFIWLYNQIEYSLKKRLPKAYKSILIIGVGTTFIGVFLSSSYGSEFLKYFNFKAQGLIENEIVTLQSYLHYTGPLGVVSIIGIIFYLLKSIIKPYNAQIIIPVLACLFTTAFWIQTYDLGYLTNPMMAIVSSLLLYDLYHALPDHKTILKYQYINTSSIALVFLLIMCMFRYIYPFYPYAISTEDVNRSIIYNEAWTDAMDWLKENSPKPNIDINRINNDQKTLPKYGIMTAWDYGNLINQRAQRTPVWSRWPSSTTASWFAITDETESLEQLCPNCNADQQVNYVVVDARMAGSLFAEKYKLAGGDIQTCIMTESITEGNESINLPRLGPCYDDSMINQLYRFDGRKLQSYRLVYSSPQESFLASLYDGQKLTLYEKPIDQVEPLILSYAKSSNVLNTDDGYINDIYVGPTVKIFEVIQ